MSRIIDKEANEQYNLRVYNSIKKLDPSLSLEVLLFELDQWHKKYIKLRVTKDYENLLNTPWKLIVGNRDLLFRTRSSEDAKLIANTIHPTIAPDPVFEYDSEISESSLDIYNLGDDAYHDATRISKILEFLKSNPINTVIAESDVLNHLTHAYVDISDTEYNTPFDPSTWKSIQKLCPDITLNAIKDKAVKRYRLCKSLRKRRYFDVLQKCKSMSISAYIVLYESKTISIQFDLREMHSDNTLPDTKNQYFEIQSWEDTITIDISNGTLKKFMEVVSYLWNGHYAKRPYSVKNMSNGIPIYI